MAQALFKQVEIVAYIVSDWQRAKKFYGETLGLPVAAFIIDETGWMEFGTESGAHLAIRLWNRPEPLPNRDGGGTAVFMVEDAYATAVELRARGVKCEEVVAIPQMVTYANFFDPDGNRLQLAGPAPKD